MGYDTKPGRCPFGYDAKPTSKEGRDFAHHALMQKHAAEGDLVTDRDPETNEDVIYVRSPELIREVLMSEKFSKTWKAKGQSTGEVDYVMNLVQPLLAETVFNMHGDENLKRRKLIRPVVANPEQFVPAIARVIDNHVAQWPSDGKVNIFSEMHELASKCVMVALVGDEVEFAFKHMKPFTRTMNYFVDRYSERGYSKDVTDLDDQRMLDLADAALRIVQEYRELGLADRAGKHGRPNTVAALMLAEGMTDKEVAATIVNLIIAGAEGVASVSAYAFEELAHNPTVQGKLAEEVSAVEKGDVAARILGQSLPYVDQCAREALRLFCPATLVLRASQEDTVLAGRPVKKGQTVGVCVPAVNKDEKQFANPNEFIPEREGNIYWMLGKEGCMATFSGGPRGCPGRHIAAMILRVLLASVIQNFELTPAGKRSSPENRVKKFAEWQCDEVAVTCTRR